MDDAVAQHDILDVISSSNRLSSFIMKRIAVASFFAALRGCVRPSAYLMVSAGIRFGMPFGVTHGPHEVGGAQRRSRRLFLTVLHFVFVFSLGGPTPSEAAGGRPLTQRSKTLGPERRGPWRVGPQCAVTLTVRVQIDTPLSPERAKSSGLLRENGKRDRACRRVRSSRVRVSVLAGSLARRAARRLQCAEPEG